MADKLPTFRGYTIDWRLQEFRRVIRGDDPQIAYIPFRSPKGQRLLRQCFATQATKEGNGAETIACTRCGDHDSWAVNADGSFHCLACGNNQA